MKLLVYNALALYSPRLQVILSVMQEMLDSGNEVTFMGCGGSLPSCASNLDHVGVICRYCVARRDKGLSMVDGRFRKRDLSSYLAAGEAESLLGSRDPFEDLPSLKALKYEGADLGYAALSSYVLVTREPCPDLRDAAVRDRLQRLVNAGKLVHRAMTNALDAERPGRVALFNGRLLTDRAALRACQKAGVDCHVYEVPLGQSRVSLYRNTLPQDVAYNTRIIEESWARGPGDKAAIARSFFEMRRHGRRSGKTGRSTLHANDPVYTGAQKPGMLPSEWREEERNVVIFNSSEDEYAAVGPEWDHTLYRDPFEGVDRICRSLAADPLIRLYLRLHPNLRGVDNAYVRDLERLGRELRNLVVIPAGSEVSTYALLDRADVVLVFRSTIGIEAVYWGKPCILLSTSFYRGMGATYNPENHEEVIRLIRSDLQPKDRAPALMVGFDRMTRGFSQPYYEGDIRKGRKHAYTFKGDRIRVGGLLRFRYRMARRRYRRRQRS